MGMHAEFKLEEIDHFIGTLRWYRHALDRDILFTEGVQFLAERAGAYWLLDEIVIAQKMLARLKCEKFQAWTLIVKGSSAVLRCDDGNDHVLFEKAIEYTDFPAPGFKLYFTDDVIMLPSEY